jgi:hypothetical protein
VPLPAIERWLAEETWPQAHKRLALETLKRQLGGKRRR